MIIVTGAAGMIGSGVVRALNDRGLTNLILVDDLKKSEKWKNLVGKQFLDLISRHSILDYLKSHTSEIDALIHLGACSDTEETDADYLMQNNFRASVQLAEWALSHNKRFIYASSAATYGDGSLGFSDQEDQIEQFQPLNMYAFSKQLFDLWMKRQGGFKQAVGLKYFNVFGPNEDHKGRMASLVRKMLHRVQREGLVELYKSTDPKFSDGEQCRDFIYLKDAVRITCDFLNSTHTGLYNVGSGMTTTWNQLASALFRALSMKPKISYVSMPEKLIKRYQNYTCADMRKLHKIFPVETRSIEASVEEYVQDYLVKDARW
jgi:ADP-L-glycero-D-manno-heptose 6-epimerase